MKFIYYSWFVSGHAIGTTFILCRRIPLENVNTESDEACSEWLHQLYREKVKYQILPTEDFFS